MQKLRGIRFTRAAQDPQERLRMIAWELWKRTTPVIFISALQRLQLPSISSPGRVVNITPPSVQIDAPKTSTPLVSSVPLTPAELEQIRSKVISKVLNKRFTQSELQAQLSHCEADILSLLVQKNVLQAQISDESIEFSDGDGTPSKRVVLCIIPRGEEA